MFSKFRTRGLVFLVACSVMACARSADAPATKSTAAVATPAAQVINIAFKSDPSPPRSGDNTVEVTVTRADGSPLNDATVAAIFYMPAMPSMNMPEMRSSFNLAPAGNGRYKGQGQLVMSGTWKVTVNVTRDGQKLGSSQFTVIAK